MINKDYFSDLPTPVITMILCLLPEEQLFKLHTRLSKKVNKALEKLPSLFPPDIPVKQYINYVFIKKLSFLENGQAKFKKNILKECTLSEDLHIVEKGFFDTRFFRKTILTNRIEKAAEAILFFTKNYIESANKDGFASLLMVAKKIDLAKQALSELDWIADYAGIKGVDLNTEKLDDLGWKKNRTVEQDFDIGNEERMRFYVYLKSFNKGVILGGLYLGNLKVQLNIHFTNKGKEVIFDSFPNYVYCSQDVKNLVAEQSQLLKKEIESSNLLS